jgi:hypothetical protein
MPQEVLNAVAADCPRMLAPAAETTRTYDLCLNIAGRWLFSRNRNHGVTLGRDTLHWTMDGEANDAGYGDITAVSLDSAGLKVVADRCTITLADGRTLRILNTDRFYYTNAARKALYREFVRDLHSRLSAARYPQIRFTEGWPLWQCQGMLALSALVAFGCAAFGLYMLLHFGAARGLILIALAGYVGWKFFGMALNNRPRDYTPDSLPDFLLS